MDDKRLFEDALVAGVLVLAQQIKLAKAAKGTHTTSDCVSDAVSLIRQKRSAILQQMRES